MFIILLHFVPSFWIPAPVTLVSNATMMMMISHLVYSQRLLDHETLYGRDRKRNHLWHHHHHHHHNYHHHHHHYYHHHHHHIIIIIIMISLSFCLSVVCHRNETNEQVFPEQTTGVSISSVQGSIEVDTRWGPASLPCSHLINRVGANWVI